MWIVQKFVLLPLFYGIFLIITFNIELSLEYFCPFFVCVRKLKDRKCSISSDVIFCSRVTLFMSNFGNGF